MGQKKKEPISLTPLSTSVLPRLLQTTECDKCGVKPGYYCRTPKGAFTFFPHQIRWRRFELDELKRMKPASKPKRIIRDR